MNKITVIGTGYVGLVTGACLSDFGNEVICMDSDSEKIERLIAGEIPIYEPNLKQIVERNLYYKRLNFTTDLEYAVKNSTVIFIAVGTPRFDDGSANMSYYDKSIDDVMEYIDDYKVIINKSTVPVGTGSRVKKKISERLSEKGLDVVVDVVSNPEFLREGSAVHDFTHQDRVVIGSDSEKAIDIVKNIYRVLYLNETPFIVTNFETAEMIKYATNAFLSMKITFINQMANLCDEIGANVQVVAKALGKDGRISSKFLHAGAGYGGSCFPKDTRALLNIAKENKVDLSLIESTIMANDNQKRYMVEKIKKEYESLENLKFCVLGLSFKPETDDIREAASIEIIKYLIELNASVNVSDPVAIKNTKEYFKNTQYEGNISYFYDEYEAMKDCDGLIIVTEWNNYRVFDFNRIKNLLKRNILFDFRNMYHRNDVTNMGFEYVGVGQ
ncbi:putative UDP-glucose 6-dehydrogenase [Peptoanaerobacter stomatis]|uniref:UDP-glucose 6-dehydrogenase n=1 Tax=Peptoanaerobacter stomatis TaxID=796937 RepID=J6HE89_9FIRM|nr:UDP-glucose/GDP-mannose dehydrogenase family protein [Peptoanaerobacter stomatis]EJU21073.1 putative UDP-glucose 6-dehydrogenase [Peptoanaerobacter stomatis]NWO25368.1 UDP-glucose/GDP-mannose dehydrogenase family protein [Peptostreptococcaceae bacterium oral taxon 081]